MAETKGSMFSMNLQPFEATKIECPRKFFDKINKRRVPENVMHNVPDSFGKLMQQVK